MVNLPFQRHDNYEGILLGSKELSKNELKAMLRRFDDIQMNAISSRCHSGMFVKATIRAHPRFIAVTAILHDRRVRQWYFRMSQPFVEFSNRIRLPGF